MKRKQYIKINGATFKLELVEGTPPESLTIATNQGLSSITQGPKKVEFAYKNKDIVSLNYAEWYVNIDKINR